MKIITQVFMECDLMHKNECTVFVKAKFTEPERGARGCYGQQLEPDFDGDVEIEEIYIQELDQVMTIEDAAELLDKEPQDLEQYLIDNVWASLEPDGELPF